MTTAPTTRLHPTPALTAVRRPAAERALTLWALVLSVSILSAFVHTVNQSLERGRQIWHAASAQAPLAAKAPVDETVIVDASIATAR
jgi:hypothetical protein